MENVRDEYVKRLEAMVEELQREHGEDLFPEAAQHAEEDGSVIADADDELPRRVDAATPDGEELELELGHAIAPENADDEFGDYPVKVHTYPMYQERTRSSRSSHWPSDRGSAKRMLRVSAPQFMG